MSTLTFADTHNMVAFLEKPAESDGFHEIIDFLNANQIRYALTVNPTMYTSYIQQFWETAKAKTVNGERHIQALIDKKKVIITETSIRSDLYLEDAGGTDCFPTATIFEELAQMGTIKQSRRKQRKDTAVTQEETQQDDSVPTLSNDPPLSVLDLEKAKDSQAKEIADLKKWVQKLERKKTSRTTGLKRLRKVSMSRRVESSKDKDSLGDHEDASKQGRSIKDIDKDADVSLVDDTQGRSDDAEIFDTNELHGVEVAMDMLVAKPNVVTTAATTTTTTRPKAGGVVVQEPIPLKRKDQVSLDEDLARNLQAQLETELIEEERLVRKQEEEANIALIKS
ncbi:hypothetical protein Tco_0659195 [Tanacetum coccineum]